MIIARIPTQSKHKSFEMYKLATQLRLTQLNDVKRTVTAGPQAILKGWRNPFLKKLHKTIREEYANTHTFFPAVVPGITTFAVFLEAQSTWILRKPSPNVTEDLKKTIRVLEINP